MSDNYLNAYELYSLARRKMSNELSNMTKYSIEAEHWMDRRDATMMCSALGLAMEQLNKAWLELEAKNEQ